MSHWFHHKSTGSIRKVGIFIRHIPADIEIKSLTTEINSINLAFFSVSDAYRFFNARDKNPAIAASSGVAVLFND